MTTKRASGLKYLMVANKGDVAAGGKVIRRIGHKDLLGTRRSSESP